MKCDAISAAATYRAQGRCEHRGVISRIYRNGLVARQVKLCGIHGKMFDLNGKVRLA